MFGHPVGCASPRKCSPPRRGAAWDSPEGGWQPPSRIRRGSGTGASYPGGVRRDPSVLHAKPVAEREEGAKPIRRRRRLTAFRGPRNNTTPGRGKKPRPGVVR